jgi:thiamine biosynthesis lipoprotein
VYFAEKEVKNEIMATDVYVCIADPSIEVKQLLFEIDSAFDLFRDFEEKFSRFIPNNELYTFNNSGGEVTVSEELFEMLEIAKEYFAITKGVFDITILPILLEEGYVTSKKDGFLSKNSNANLNKSYTMNDLILNKKYLTVNKPLDLNIDLGGIGKGFIVNKVAKVLSKNFENYIVDAGGDMYVSGKNLKHNYDYWAIDIESPADSNESLYTLMLSNKGVATSGINKRKWTHLGKEKNHLIDIKKSGSVCNNLLTNTIVSDSVIEADILAKSLLIMGLEDGLKFATDNNLAACFIDKDNKSYLSTEMENYVWKS